MLLSVALHELSPLSALNHVEEFTNTNPYFRIKHFDILQFLFINLELMFLLRKQTNFSETTIKSH